MSLPPTEIPLGAMRFNSDSQKLEYWNGSAWFQIKTFSPNLEGGTRGVFWRGHPNTDVIDFITIETAGNATDFGDALSSNRQGGACSSSTRSFCLGSIRLGRVLGSVLHGGHLSQCWLAARESLFPHVPLRQIPVVHGGCRLHGYFL